MKLIRKLADWCVPPSALTNWVVPLRRVDSMMQKLLELQAGTKFDVAGRTVGATADFIHHQITFNERIAEGTMVWDGDHVYVHPLCWHGGLAPWKP